VDAELLTAITTLVLILAWRLTGLALTRLRDRRAAGRS